MDDFTYRQHLDEKHENVQRLQAILLRELRSVTGENQEFGRLLRAILAGLGDLDRIEDAEEKKRLIAIQAERLLKAHGSLTCRFAQTFQTLEQIATHSSQLADELQRICELSITDELTGLANRREFQRKLENEIERAARYAQPLTLVMLDLDNFKAVNDTYGHPIGDRILVAYARDVFSVFRRHDTVARYGGEEFEILLPNTTAEGALHALEKIRSRARKVSIQEDGQRIELPTFSAGVAVYQQDETAADFFARADAALYEAKRRGRNRVEFAPETVPPHPGKGGALDHSA